MYVQCYSDSYKKWMIQAIQMKNKYLIPNMKIYN